jgi:hypothetical protein
MLTSMKMGCLVFLALLLFSFGCENRTRKPSEPKLDSDLVETEAHWFLDLETSTLGDTLENRYFSSEVSTNLRSQLRDLLEFKSFEKLLNEIETFKLDKTDFNIKKRIVLRSTLVNNFEQVVLEIRYNLFTENDHSTFLPYIFEIQVIKKSDELIYHRATEFRKVKIDSTWQSLESTFCQYENNKLCIQLDDDYASFYQTKLNVKDLFLSNIVFGKRCNEGGEKPKYRKTLDSLILSTDTTALKTWLNSPSLEKQLYALDGLYELKETKGFEFNKQILKAINQIEKKKGIVNTCSGCMYLSDSIGDVLERVKNRNFF